MHSHSILGRPLKAGPLAFIAWVWLALAGPSQAGQYHLLAEQANTVVIAARVQNAEQLCNLEIAVQGQPVIEREVQVPYFETRIDITPQALETVTVTWRGKFKRVNDAVVNACPTQGRSQFSVVSDNGDLRAAWARLLASMGPAKAECVRTALQTEGVRYEWFDLSDKQVSPHDWRIQRALTQCDGFVAQKKAWGDQNPQSFACVLPGGLKTQCEGFYTATDNGKTQPVPMALAIQRQLENKVWGTGVRETAAAKAGRYKKEKALQAKLAAEEAAKIQAEEEARLKALQLAKQAEEAQARERKEKAEAERAKRLQEIERKEEERLEKRSWMLKQLEKLKRDPKADAKSEDGKDKPSKGKEEPPKDAKPPVTAPKEAPSTEAAPKDPAAKEPPKSPAAEAAKPQ